MATDATKLAIEVADLCTQAIAAYDRTDLSDRVHAARRRLADPSFHVLVVGEFKQGKSTLVNALLNIQVCPVDDDIATSAPTAVRFGEEPAAWVTYRPDEDDDSAPAAESDKEQIPLDEVQRFVTESANPENQRRVQAVDIAVPRRILSDGLVLVDTPGVGGLGSAHTTTTIGALPMANAVLFVTDASQEFTQPELDFLQTARKMCPNVLVVLSKIDFYPHWRQILELDEGHLAAAGIEASILPVSSTLRTHAIQNDDKDLNAESGFAALVQYLQQDIVGRAEELTLAGVGQDLASVAGQLHAQFESERSALSDPEKAQEVMAGLEEAKARADDLRGQAAKWQQTLGDGIADLTADVDHDLRSRMRNITRQADDSLENSDPADSWEEFEAWLYRRVAEDVTHNYTFLHLRAEEVAERVAEHFAEASQDVATPLPLSNPMEVLQNVDVEAGLDVAKQGVVTSGMTALRGSYGGMLMFGMLGRMAGLAMANPATLVLGLMMGRKAMRDEKERQVSQRRAQAKNSFRKYTDEVTFIASKDSRDTLRRIQRELRDHYTSIAEELQRSLTETLQAAQQAAQSTEAERTTRLRDVTAELDRIGGLKQRIAALRESASSS